MPSKNTHLRYSQDDRRLCREFFVALPRRARIAVVAHQRPDGDAAGSVLGLARLLRTAGFDARAVGLGNLPLRYRFLPEPGETPQPGLNWPAGEDAIVTLDCGSRDRLEPFVQAALDSVPVVNIDHHAANERFGTVNWIDPDASSTGEMILRLARDVGWMLALGSASALWVAIATDTGCFSYSNTSPSTLRATADLVEAGADPEELSRRVFRTVSLAETKLLARALGRMEVSEGGRLAEAWLVPDDFLACGGSAEETQDVVAALRNVIGVEAAIFYYQAPGMERPKASVRTAAPHDAAGLCRQFGGGGHARAAGCYADPDLTEGRRRVSEAARALFFGVRRDGE